MKKFRRMLAWPAQLVQLSVCFYYIFLDLDMGLARRASVKFLWRLSAQITYRLCVMMRVSQEDVGALVERYAEMSGRDEEVADALAFILRLRMEVADAEDPRFDDAQVNGLRFFKAYAKYSGTNGAPSAIDVIDDHKGVLAFCDIPLKIYCAMAGVGPRRNKTRVGALEAGAAYQTTLGSLAPGFELATQRVSHVLLRVELDDGMPEVIRWEEYDPSGGRVWSIDLLRDDEESAASPVVPVTPRQPPPTRPTRDPVLPPGGDVLEPGDDDGGDEHD